MISKLIELFNNENRTELRYEAGAIKNKSGSVSLPFITKAADEYELCGISCNLSSLAGNVKFIELLKARFCPAINQNLVSPFNELPIVIDGRSYHNAAEAYIGETGLQNALLKAKYNVPNYVCSLVGMLNKQSAQTEENKYNVLKCIAKLAMTDFIYNEIKTAGSKGIVFLIEEKERNIPKELGLTKGFIHEGENLWGKALIEAYAERLESELMHELTQEAIEEAPQQQQEVTVVAEASDPIVRGKDLIFEGGISLEDQALSGRVLTRAEPEEEGEREKNEAPTLIQAPIQPQPQVKARKKLRLCF